MKIFDFFKMTAAGNDFVLVKGNKDSKASRLAPILCDRREGIGADGILLVYQKPRLGFDYYNRDGSRAFCGNGMRAAAWWMYEEGWPRGEKTFELETPRGILRAQIIGRQTLSVQMPKASGVRLNLPVSVLGHSYQVHTIDTGVPHAVVIVKKLDQIDMNSLGKAIRNHPHFSPAGTNVDFVEIKSGKIYIRTFERGVEAETLACGTGVVAAAILSHFLGRSGKSIYVVAPGGRLKVSFEPEGRGASDIFLEGPAKIVYQGKIKL